MKQEIKTGIYKITNITNNKLYIGQSIDIATRWYSHRSELNGNRHCNEHLQNSWNKYGSDSFVFEVIEYCNQSELNEREMFWIDYYNSFDPKYGYNKTKGGDGILGHKFSEKVKEKLYISSKSNEIVQLTIYGEYVNRWRSSAQASKSLKIPVSGIRQCVLHEGDQYICHGYIWVLATEYDNNIFNYEDYKKHLYYYLRPISKYDLYGNKIAEWNSQSSMNNGDNNISKFLKRLLTHAIRQHDGYIYIYSDESDMLTEEYLRNCRIKSHNYKVKQLDLSNNLIKIYTIDELDELPYRMETILKCCSNRYMKTKGGLYKAFGYIWEYE